MTNQQLIEMVRRMIPEQIARGLVGVAPIDGSIIKMMQENASSEEQLVEEGYEPVCPYTRLLWTKTEI